MNYTELIDKDRKFIKRIIIAVIIIVSISFSLVFIMAFIIPYNNGDDVSFLGCTINRNKQEDNKTKLSTDSTKFYKNDGKEQNKRIESTEKREKDKKEEKPITSIVNSKNVNLGTNNGYIGDNIIVTEKPKRKLNSDTKEYLIKEINNLVKEKTNDIPIVVNCLNISDPEPCIYADEIISFLKTKFEKVSFGEEFDRSGCSPFKNIRFDLHEKGTNKTIYIIVGTM